ncbi:hypothetical protein UPYG_G00000990 [Umbra pygmaea]|uniref:Uncharacterized protein n=1 Tax=Umbra pygmaea TaxID=75934 RepID=A0ABD0XGD1_UMBPY
MGLQPNRSWVRPGIPVPPRSIMLTNLSPQQLSTNYTGLVVYAVFFGTSAGCPARPVETDRLGRGIALLTNCGTSSPIVGMFYDVYGNYTWTYLCCGIILVIGSIFLFVGMGINYTLLNREKEKERKQREQDEVEEPNAVTPMTDVSKMDEDTI